MNAVSARNNRTRRGFAQLLFAALLCVFLPACTNAATGADVTQPSLPTEAGTDEQTTTPTDTAVITDDTDGTDDNAETEPPETNVPPTEEADVYTYDIYTLSPYVEGFLGDDLHLYRDFIDAIYAYDPVIEGFESQLQFEKVWMVVLSDFIPSQKLLMSYLYTEEPFVYDDGTVTVGFRLDRDEHMNILAAFDGKMNDILSGVRLDAAEEEKAKYLYSYVASDMHYEFTLGDTFYDAIMGGFGICGDYALYLETLYCAVGLDCMGVHSWDEPTVDAHAWVIANIDGEYYHIDPTFESTGPGAWMGELGYSYFGMTDERRRETGIIGEWEPDVYYSDQDENYYGKGPAPVLPECTSERFSDGWIW